MEIVHLTTGDHEDWVEYYERVGEPGPYHRPDYLQILAGNFEHDDERAEAFVLEDGNDIIYYPFIRRSLESVPFADEAETDLSEYDDIVSSWYYGGPFTSRGDSELCEAFAEAFDNFCRSENIVAEFVRFDPNERNHEGFDCLGPEFNRETVRVDLTKTEETLWENYEGRNKRAIKQAWDTKISIEEMSSEDDLEAFHDIYSNAMEAKDASEHYRFTQDFFKNILTHNGLASLLVARYDDEVIGGFITVHDDRTAYHYLSASNPDYWDMRVNNLLYHEVIMYCKSMGCSLFDFQGGRPNVFKFKKGFSPDREELYLGKVIHMDEIYDSLVSQAEDSGIDTSGGYFPEYRVEKSN